MSPIFFFFFMTYLLNYLSLCARRTRGATNAVTKFGARKGSCVFIDRWIVCFGARTETFRSLSVFTLRAIGPSQWVSSISCRRGYAKILKSEGLCVPNACVKRAAAIFVTGLIVVLYRPAVVWELKSVRFPWVYLSCKIRHRPFTLFTRLFKFAKFLRRNPKVHAGEIFFVLFLSIFLSWLLKYFCKKLYIFFLIVKIIEASQLYI